MDFRGLLQDYNILTRAPLVRYSPEQALGAFVGTLIANRRNVSSLLWLAAIESFERE